MEGCVRVLVSEGHEFLRHMIGQTLRRLGCSCDCAADATHALMLAGTVPYDLVITDLAPPFPSGFDFVLEIRGSDANAATPILVVSADGEEPEGFLAAHGVQGYLKKPFGIRKLQQSLEDVLQRPLWRSCASAL